MALERIGRDYRVNPGDGAFYGPKIDFHVTDALGRSWQLGTCQLDFFMPERFDLTYQGADNQDHRPLMIHRALLGSMERFAGILIEHYGGRFPDWLAPTQAAILPVADRHIGAADAMLAELRERGVRARVDSRSESVGRKIRDAELGKVPYMLVVGDREARGRRSRRPLARGRRPRRDGRSGLRGPTLIRRMSCKSLTTVVSDPQLARRPTAVGDGPCGRRRGPISAQSPSRCLYCAPMQVSQTTSRRF